MTVKDMVPWKWGKKDVPIRHDDRDPFLALQSRIDSIFDDFRHGFDLGPLHGSWSEAWHGRFPRIDVTENDKEYLLTAELPGMDENDVELSLSDNVLTLRGEKKAESSERKSDYSRMERFYGTFQRIITLNNDIKAEDIKARFHKGVLEVRLPKSEEGRKNSRRIKVETA